MNFIIFNFFINYLILVKILNMYYLQDKQYHYLDIIIKLIKFEFVIDNFYYEIIFIKKNDV